MIRSRRRRLLELPFRRQARRLEIEPLESRWLLSLGYPIETVALESDEAPGVAGDVAFADFEVGAPRIGIDACKTGRPTACNFGYGGALTETVLLANVAYRAGQRLRWDAKKLTAANCPEAQRYIEPRYRNGWTL